MNGLDPVTISTANDPMLALLVAILTPQGAGWLVVLVVVGFYFVKGGRAKRTWAWFAGMFRTVDTLGRVDTSLDALKSDVVAVDQRVTAHLADADQRNAVITTGMASLAERVGESRDDMREIRSRLDEVVFLSREVRHEVKNNGGSSLKDSAHRIERAMGLTEPTDNRRDPTPTPWPPALEEPLPERTPA